jgi:nucleoside-diphosphate-sugar epimerase
VKDCAAGIQLIHNAPALDQKAYNVGGGCAPSNRELLDAVVEQVPTFGATLSPGRSPRARSDPYMDISRAAALGYQPQFDVAAGVADYAAWLRNNPE